jgi:hypothetical protein
MNSVSRFFGFVLALALVIPSAFAGFDDLVVINENEEGFVWSIVKNAQGQDMIVIRSCPRN